MRAITRFKPQWRNMTYVDFGMDFGGLMNLDMSDYVAPTSTTPATVTYIDPAIQPPIVDFGYIAENAAALQLLAANAAKSSAIYGNERDAARYAAEAVAAARISQTETSQEAASRARIAAEKASEYAASLATKAAITSGTSSIPGTPSGSAAGTGIGIGTDINVQSQGLVAKSTEAVNKLIETDPQSFYIAGVVIVIGILALILKK